MLQRRDEKRRKRRKGENTKSVKGKFTNLLDSESSKLVVKAGNDVVKDWHRKGG